MRDNKIKDIQGNITKANAMEILNEMKKRHDKTGECGIYDITPDGKLGKKLRDL